MTWHDSWLLTCWPMIFHLAKVSVAVWGAIVEKLLIPTFWGETDIKTIYPDCIQVQESPINREYLCHVNMFQFGMPCVSEFWCSPPHDFNVIRFSLPLVNPNAAPLEVGNDAWHNGFFEEARAKYLCSFKGLWMIFWKQIHTHLSRWWGSKPMLETCCQVHAHSHGNIFVILSDTHPNWSPLQQHFVAAIGAELTTLNHPSMLEPTAADFFAPKDTERSGLWLLPAPLTQLKLRGSEEGSDSTLRWIYYRSLWVQRW